MKREVLLDGIQRTLGIVEKKTTMPILSNILLTASGDGLRIVATDRDIWLIADYEANVKGKGEITVNARKIYEIVREIEGDTVSIKVAENNWVFVTCDKVVFRIPGIPASEYPQVAQEDGRGFITIGGDALKEMIRKTYFAISVDEMRPSLNGAYFEIEKGLVKMVATDGHRLSLSTMDIEGGKSLKGVIIPAEIMVKDSVCVVKVKNITFRINLIDAEYPDYKKVIPKDKSTEVQVDRNKFLHAMRRMSIMSSERSSGVKIELVSGWMKLTSTNPDLGEAKDEIDISYEGKPLEVGYSVRYVLDAIEVMEEESVKFEIRGNEGPGIIRSVENDRYMCIIMPIKLREE
ncbi:MAG: DNA polymerase III subunit beta [Deltaproteobacteria bacterium]|nr:DNA polymerase III subunit beta [Deltaproteobacteria bacterium]